MQTTKNILLIRPSNFIFNAETAASNPFQVKLNESEEAIKQKAFEEFETFATTLKSKGVNVFIFDDTKHPENRMPFFRITGSHFILMEQWFFTLCLLIIEGRKEEATYWIH